MFRKRKKRPKSDARVLFMFIALLLTVLVIGIVLQRSMTGRTAVDEQPPQDAFSPADSLPPDAGNISTPVRLEPSVDPSFVYVYTVGGQGKISLVEWDRPEGRFILRATLDTLLRPPYGTRLEDARWSGQDAVVVTGEVDGSLPNIAIVLRQGRGLAVIQARGADGRPDPRGFRHMKGGGRFDSFQLIDVTGDGVMEALQTEGSVALAANGLERMQKESVVAYSWKDGRLVYDDGLSRMLTLSGQLFPEPPRDPDGS